MITGLSKRKLHFYCLSKMLSRAYIFISLFTARLGLPVQISQMHFQKIKITFNHSLSFSFFISFSLSLSFSLFSVLSFFFFLFFSLSISFSFSLFLFFSLSLSFLFFHFLSLFLSHSLSQLEMLIIRYY